MKCAEVKCVRSVASREWLQWKGLSRIREGRELLLLFLLVFVLFVDHGASLSLVKEVMIVGDS